MLKWKVEIKRKPSYFETTLVIGNQYFDVAGGVFVANRLREAIKSLLKSRRETNRGLPK